MNRKVYKPMAIRLCRGRGGGASRGAPCVSVGGGKNRCDLPLHFAVFPSGPRLASCREALMAAHPVAASTLNVCGELPLFVAVQSRRVRSRLQRPSFCVSRRTRRRRGRRAHGATNCRFGKRWLRTATRTSAPPHCTPPTPRALPCRAVLSLHALCPPWLTRPLFERPTSVLRPSSSSLLHLFSPRSKPLEPHRPLAARYS